MSANMSNFKKPSMVRIQNSLSFDMVKIEAGSFQMGSDEYYDEEPIHKVTIDYEFELCKYPVTIAEYMHFAKKNEKHLPEWKQVKSNNYQKMNLTDNAPIIGISWHDAVAYCKWLNEQQKVYVYRLPSEAEWEYTCRADSTSKWSFGDDEKKLDDYAWYRKNSDSSTHIVGQKTGNTWELKDMHGNVYEWCQDDYVDSYKETPIDGKAYIDKEAKSKLIRGGSWINDADVSRCAIRSRGNPFNRINNVGFRLLRTLP